MSFIKKENEDDKMAKSDIMLVVAVAVIGLGLWWYTTSSKNASYKAFTEAQQLIDDKQYEKAFDTWFALQNISYKSDSLDSILYKNLSFLEDLKTGNLESYRAINKLLEDSIPNQLKIQQRLSVIQEPYFLKEDQVSQVKSWRSQFGTAPVPTAPIDSSAQSPADSTQVLDSTSAQKP